VFGKIIFKKGAETGHFVSLLLRLATICCMIWRSCVFLNACLNILRKLIQWYLG